MANPLTGDFDIVAQFSVPAVNRLLAAMHGIKRFPHSLSLRVDDVPRPPNDHGVRPSLTEIIDIAGESVFHPGRIRDVLANAPDVAATFDAASRFDAIVNLDNAGIFLPPIEPSHLKGRLQVQLAPPMLEIADANRSRIRVRMALRSRYFPDPQTPVAAQFARGELVITTAVNQITSQLGSSVDIDLRSSAVQAVFVPNWSSAPLSAADRARVDQLIANALKSSVLPSNTTLPSGISAMKFKAMTGSVSVLVNTDTSPGNPASANNSFLNGSNFGFAIAAETMQRALASVATEILSTPIAPFEVSIPGRNPVYTVVLRAANLHFRAGRIVLEIKGRATTPSWTPNFDFTVSQNITLRPVGTTAEIELGDISLDTDSWFVNRFRDRALSKIRPIRDQALAQSGANDTVRRMLDTDRNLGPLFRSLLTPARPDNQPQPQPHHATLTYASAEISPDGIVLRGQMNIANVPSPAVEFSEIADTGTGPVDGTMPAQTEYSAFKSWIPGGTIDGFEWKRFRDTQTGSVDDKKFVLVPQGPVVASDEAFARRAPGLALGFNPMCLTLHGTRLSMSGPIAPRPVTASYCAFPWFPLFEIANVSTTALMASLTRPGADGLVEVVAQVPAVRNDRPTLTPNRIVHFGDGSSAAQLAIIEDAVVKAGRDDAATAIVAVLSPQDLKAARHVEGVAYVEHQDDRWEKAWRVDVTKRPTTLVINPDGKVAWQHSGSLEAGALTETLRRALKPVRMTTPLIVNAGVRLGQAPPNFAFAHGQGGEMTLRKLSGRPVTLVFVNSDANGADIIRDCEYRARQHNTEDKAGVVITIDAAGSPSADKQQARDSAASVVVHDAGQSIARAFGVSAWPTTVFIDARGLVRAVHHGRAGDSSAPNHDAAN